MTNERSETARSLALAERVCARKGLSLTETRRRVLELLLESDGPTKAYDLLAALRPGGASARPPTVYRALDFLVGAGLAHKVEALNAYTACIHGEESGTAELFICEACGRVDERHDPHPVLSAPDGFNLRRSVIEHYGLCADCRDAA
jgi:Fur family zinc uptake transcriptional regulator